MSHVLDDAALDQLFRTARTQNAFLDKPVDDSQLKALYELLKWGPTAANGSPARFDFVKSPDAKAWFDGPREGRTEGAFRNGSLQGAYLILAARALGLDAGPMSGFANAKVDEAFFKGTAIKSNFLVNLGYGDASGLFPRLPRLSFDEAARIA